MNPLITEILGIARQGITKPIFCKANDHKDYLVKGNYAGKRALIAEWLAGNLGRTLGLPIPPFTLLHVDDSFFGYSVQKEELQILGRGTLFGSNWKENLVEVRHSNIPQINEVLRAKILAFDWWVGNDDRTLTDKGGNPNLLWSDSDHELTVIDHNLAFDYDEPSDFWMHHIFRDDRNLWSETFRNDMEAVFVKGLKELPMLWQNLPEDWTEEPTGLSFEEIRAKLSRFETEPASFWRLP